VRREACRPVLYSGASCGPQLEEPMSLNQIDDPIPVRVTVIKTSDAQAPVTSNTSTELRIVLATVPLVIQVGDPIPVTKP
jgi:hypothetical protein